MSAERKRRRRQAEATVPRLDYAECSRSVQTRRRAEVQQLVQELGGSAAGGAQLLGDLARSSGVGQGALDAVVENVRQAHAASPDSVRTQVLALVAGALGGAELRRRGFVFGTHQLAEARRIATEGRLDLLPRPRPPRPASKQPKDPVFVSRLHSFLAERSDDEGVLQESLRTLHREFVAQGPESRLSFSAFRALALERFQTAQQAEAAEKQPPAPVAHQPLDLAALLNPQSQGLLLPPPPPMDLGDLSLLQSSGPQAAAAVSSSTAPYAIPSIQSVFDFSAGSQVPDDDDGLEFLYL